MTIQLKAGTVAANPWEQASLFVNDKLVPWQGAVVLLRGQDNDVRVEAPPELARQLNLELVESGGLKLEAFPKFGDWVDPDNGNFNWKIKSDDDLSGKITLLFLSKEEVAPWPLECWAVSTDLNQEKPTVKVDNIGYPPGGFLWFWNDSKTVTVTFPAESPMQDYPLTLTAILVAGLQDGDVSVVQSKPHEWTVSANSARTGRFKLELTGQGMTIGVTLPQSRVLSQSLDNEAALKQNGSLIPAGGHFTGGSEYTLTLDYKGAQTLIGVPLAIQLIPAGDITAADFSSAPTAGHLTPIHSWTVKLNHLKSGTFGLKVYTEGEKGRLITANHQLSKPNYSGVTLKFAIIGGIDAPVPPDMVMVGIINSFPLSAKLMFPGTIPLIGVSVKIVAPEKDTFTGTTNSNGFFTTPLIGYRTVGIRECTAEATLPDGTKRTASVLINVQRENL